MIFVLNYLSLAMSLQPAPDRGMRSGPGGAWVPHVLIMYLSHIFSLDLAPGPVSGHPHSLSRHSGLTHWGLSHTATGNHRLYFEMNGKLQWALSVLNGRTNMWHSVSTASDVGDF